MLSNELMASRRELIILSIEVLRSRGWDNDRHTPKEFVQPRDCRGRLAKPKTPAQLKKARDMRRQSERKRRGVNV